MAEVIDDNTIPNGLSADVMRELLQSKNMLKNKGDMYIGTGIQENEVYKTEILSGPSKGGLVLAGTNTGSGVEVQYQSAVDVLNEDLRIGGREGNVKIGDGAEIESGVSGGIAIGANTYVFRTGGIAIGEDAQAISLFAVSLGGSAQSSGINSMAIGKGAQALADNAIAIGSTKPFNDPNEYRSGVNSIAIGYSCATIENAIAIGFDAKAVARDACQIGRGVNDTADTLQFQNKVIVRGGKIHADSADSADSIVDSGPGSPTVYYKISVVKSPPPTPDDNTIYFVKP